ncbi:MAG: type II toxin-antitoxin system RelE/ParE family toxin [Dehalococcoidales bacterium]|nr:type II toxin-antitoxin system RelE/ParE family toxin [Dehalococcoidales bacterium]
MDWRIVFYRDVSGEEPVKDFILEQPDGAIGEILHVFDLLYRFGLSLALPYVEKVQGKIWALRIKHSSDYYRILYFACSGKKFILLHGIKKKADKLRNTDIDLAIKRMQDYEAND